MRRVYLRSETTGPRHGKHGDDKWMAVLTSGFLTGRTLQWQATPDRAVRRDRRLFEEARLRQYLPLESEDDDTSAPL